MRVREKKRERERERESEREPTHRFILLSMGAVRSRVEVVE